MVFPMNGLKFMLFALGAALFSACSDFETIDPYTRTGAPERGASLSSSSDAEQNSSSSVITSVQCGSISIDPATHFCFNNLPYELCGDYDYRPTYEFCSGTGIYAKCGTAAFEPASEFCLGITVYGKCGGTVEYNPSTEACCGNDKYTPSASNFCFNNSKVVAKCGARPEEFDPDLYECREGDKIYLKTPLSYEGESYDAVLIGAQTWMAKNLNYDVPDVSTDVCYSLNESNCAIYGRLYEWATAKDICPSGWHIPSEAEWSALTDYAGGNYTLGTKLKAASLWKTYSGGDITGTDIYGFAALPGGYYGDAFSGVGESGHWWMLSENNTISKVHMSYSSSYTYMNQFNNKYLYSVRCIKDRL